MASIPGWAYILIGGVLCSVSAIVGAKVKTNSLTLFFYVGAIFIIIGILKLVLLYFKSKRQEKIMMRSRGVQNNQLRGGVNNKGHNSTAGSTRQNNRAVADLSRQVQNTSNNQGQHHQVRQSSEHHISKAHPVNNPHPTILTCPKCGTKHYPYANFCMMCGTQMRFK